MATITLRATKGSPLTNNEVDANFNNLNTELGTKFAAADFTGANILTQIKTVDGALSGLDADTVDGFNQATTNTANTLVTRDGSGNFAANIITANTFSGQFSGTAAITSGSITGITDLAIADGGTGASTAAQARTNLGLAIGSDVQAYDTQLTALGGVTAASDKVPYFTGSTTADVMTVTSTARTLLDDTSISAMRSTLGLSIGSNIQPYDADLSGLAALSSTGLVIRTGNGTYANRTITASGGLTITNGDGISGNINISSGQDISTTSNVQFRSLGIGTGASGTSGQIDCEQIQTNNISLEGGKHHITANDGGGNFNIRVANDFTSGCTEAGYASHWIFNQIDGSWIFKTSTTSLAVGATPAFQDNLIMAQNGNLTALGNVTAYSDLRIKDNIEPIANALNKVDLLNGYTFDRTDIDTPRQTGVIAQEVQAVLPEAVSETDEGTLTVAYGNMMGLMIEAIKELKAEIDELKGAK